MLRTTEALDREWRAEHEHSPAGMAAVARWNRAEPALRELDDLGEVLAVAAAEHEAGRFGRCRILSGPCELMLPVAAED